MSHSYESNEKYTSQFIFPMNNHWEQANWIATTNIATYSYPTHQWARHLQMGYTWEGVVYCPVDVQTYAKPPHKYT